MTTNDETPTPAPASSPWMTLTEAATYAKRGRRFLAREVRAGRLRAARIGGRGELLLRVEWIDEWLEHLATPVMLPARRRA
jgi:excisionase family DNA binding protein